MTHDSQWDVLQIVLALDITVSSLRLTTLPFASGSTSIYSYTPATYLISSPKLYSKTFGWRFALWLLRQV